MSRRPASSESVSGVDRADGPEPGLALIAVWLLMAVAMNVALADSAPAPTIPIDDLIDAFVRSADPGDLEADIAN
ncbi:MAG TPA: hypothetical protein VGT60_03775 [Candidatus Limnocylindria bacterium]|nr:hypothetical protein [Candidatus Limnocylindria bacterium]